MSTHNDENNLLFWTKVPSFKSIFLPARIKPFMEAIRKSDKFSHFEKLAGKGCHINQSRNEGFLAYTSEPILIMREQ